MSNSTVGFLSPEHKAAFMAAVTDANAARDDNSINAYYGASLYLLTGLRNAWPRLRGCISHSCIDHEEMLGRVGLSSGEALIVRLSGNLYNGSFWRGSPWDLVSGLDEELFSLALEALRLRRCRMNLFGEEVSVA